MKQTFSLCVVGLVLALAGCGGGGGGSDTTSTAAAPLAATTQSVSIEFAAVNGVANTPVNCATPIAGLGSTSSSASLVDLRFYLTDVQLINDKGVAVPVKLDANSWQYTSGTDTATLIDLEDGTAACAATTSGPGTAGMNTVVTGTVPSGTYVKVKATVGLPDALNHGDPMMAAPPLDRQDMGWSWQNGYKFIKLEVNPAGGVSAGAGSASTYSLHLASTDCTGGNVATATCAKKNLAQFTLDFNASSQKLALDVGELFNTTDIKTNQTGAVGCMSDVSDTDCSSIFPKVGLNLATGGQAGAQTVFRAIAK